jgi:hypothetical protein
MGDSRTIKTVVVNKQGTLYQSPPKPSDSSMIAVSGNQQDTPLSKTLFISSPAKDIKTIHALKDNCLALCGELCEILAANRHMLTESSRVCSAENFTSRCTVGIMLHGVKVENTLIGGPSFGLLEKGDIIVRIDGDYVSEADVFEKLKGCDIPGSQVLITVERLGSSSPLSVKSLRDFDGLDTREVEVMVTRMATAEIADRRRMFDLFTVLEVSVLLDLLVALIFPLAVLCSNRFEDVIMFTLHILHTISASKIILMPAGPNSCKRRQ